MSQELSIDPNNLPSQPSSQILSPEEVAKSVLSVFKRTIRDAGSLTEAEYQLQYRRAEDQMKMYLQHLLSLLSNTNHTK